MLRKRCEGVWIGRVGSSFKVKVQGQGVCVQEGVVSVWSRSLAVAAGQAAVSTTDMPLPLKPQKKTEQTATGSRRVGLDWICLKFNERSGFGFLTARDRTSPWQIHQIHILPRPFPVRLSSPHPKNFQFSLSLSPQKQQERNQDDTIFEHTHTPCPRPYTFQEASWTTKPNLFTPTWKDRAETMESDIGREFQMVSVQMKFELI